MRLSPVWLLSTLAITLTTRTVCAATVTQANGDPIPTTQKICDGATQTTGGLAAVFASRTCTPPDGSNIGAPCNTPELCAAIKQEIVDSGVVCETTWLHGVNDDACAIDPLQGEVIGLNPWTDVQTGYNTFRPLPCTLTFSVVSRGLAMFQDVFGWYNVDPNGPPSIDDLHVMLSCDTPDGAEIELDPQNDPAYRGGDIGYFLLTPEDRQNHKSCAEGNCCASLERYQAGVGYLYYTQPQYNPEALYNGNPYVHFIAYDSRLTRAKFYFAWEDLYEPTGSDFTDVVVSVEGAECAGGGQPCSVEGALGHCAEGRTACKLGELVCNAIRGPASESCNGVDDDCNGAHDDGAVCPPGEVCHQGRCQPECSTGEFRCADPKECDPSSGLCVEAGCVGIECPPGEICSAGNCQEPCLDVVCPFGQVCLGNECIDLCAGVSCPSGESCVDGACLSCAQCGGVGCAAPLLCNPTSGACEDPTCTTPCPAGTSCSNGACVDDCVLSQAHCPGGASCANGSCSSGDGHGGAGGSGIVIINGGTGSAPATPGSVSTPGERVDTKSQGAPGCACSVTRQSPFAPLTGLLVLGVANVLRGVKRRRKLSPRVL